MWWDSDGDLLPGLLPGLYRGVNFHVPDASTVAGRRVAEYLFLGVDAPGYDDFGLYPAEVTVNGVIVGDDYVAQGRALQAAFETAGPATLVHPWLGPMTVILRDPGEVNFSDRELRVCRFNVTFIRVVSGGISIASTLSGLLSAASAIVSGGAALASAVGVRVLSSSRQKAAARSHRILDASVAALSAPRGARGVTARLAKLTKGTSADPGAFDRVAAGVGAVISTISRTPAVSASAEAIAAEQPTALALTTLGLDLADALVSAVTSAPGQADAALLLAAAARILGSSLTQGAYIAHESRGAALAYRARAIDVTEALAEALDALDGGVVAAEGAALRRAARALGSAVILDVNESLGRLPVVQIIQAERPLDAFLIAAHLGGDDPARIEAIYDDIVARNGPRHPAALEGAIEVKL